MLTECSQVPNDIARPSSVPFRSEEELGAAIAAGRLVESLHLDLKRELPSGEREECVPGVGEKLTVAQAAPEDRGRGGP